MRLILAAIAAAILAGSVATAASPPSMALPPLPPGDAARLLDDVRILSADDMQGRAPDTPGSAMARAYVERRLAAVGVRPASKAGFDQPFVIQAAGKTLKGVNIVGMIPGLQKGGRVMVVTAHYDHLGVKGGQIYNGADDNASGVAGLLAVAEAFRRHPPRHTIIFAALDGEELGLLGAEALVAQPPVPLDRIALNVNFDMLSKNAKGELYASGSTPWPFLRPRLDAIAAKAPVRLLQGHDSGKLDPDDWTNQSDHYAFREKKIPWVYFGVEDHPEYHKPTDDFATIPQPFFRASAATVVAACRDFDRDLDAIAKDSGR
jgi:Zn-dependent M28 family amino/carboxypeptidase